MKSLSLHEFWSILNRLGSTKPENSIDLYALYEHLQQLGRFSENQIDVDLDHIDMDAYIDDRCELNRIFTNEETSRERPKSAPYLRLKNSKRTSKCQVLSSTVPEKVSKNFLSFFVVSGKSH